MSETKTASETKSVVMERVMAHPPEKIWRALTQTAMLAEWLMDNDFQPVVGHKCQFHWSRGEYKGDVSVEVKVVDAPKRLAYTWGDGSPAQGTLLTLVTWTLEPTGAGTRLRMEQTGFTEAQEQARRGAEFGWNGFMPKLEALLEK